MVSSYPFVSIIFPTLDGWQDTKKCLESITRLSYSPKRLEVIIIDNGSTDETLRQVTVNIYELTIRVIKNKKNLGFGRAVNQGIRRAKGELVFITNNDVVFEKDSIKTLVSYLNRHPEIGVVGGKILSLRSPKTILSAGHKMNPWTGNVYPSPNPEKLKEVDWIQGAGMLIPKKVIKKVGLLDESYSHFFEDFDLCLRIKRSGFKVTYFPKAIFWHGGSTTANRNINKKYFEWYKNKIRFILKNMPLANVISILFIQTCLVVPYRALILQDGRFLAFVKGLFSNIKGGK